MFKPAQVTASTVASPQALDLRRSANKVFRVQHGLYGNLFLSRYSTGRVSESGQDEGIIAAQKVWAARLATFDDAVVASALEAMERTYQEFPPTLPQFVTLCKSCQPRESYKPAVPAIPMSQQKRSEYAARSRAIVDKYKAKEGLKDKAKTAQSAPGLDLIKQLVAHAVALAGGDEVAKLLELDVALTPKVPA